MLSGLLSLVVLAAGFSKRASARSRARADEVGAHKHHFRMCNRCPSSSHMPALRRAGVFLVENIECRQVDVGDFLLVERDFVTHYGILRQHIRNWRSGCCGHSAR